MKKIILFLLIFVIIIPVTCFNTFAEQNKVTVYKTPTAPVIDGELDDCYEIFANSLADNEFVDKVSSGTSNNDVKFYSCWDDDYLYIYAKAVCNGTHVAYVDETGADDTAKHWIFNAHYLMTAICPDDSTKSQYTGTESGGGWSWTPLHDANYMYEYTMIEDSRTGANDIRDHFNTISKIAEFSYEVNSKDGFDCYEQRIPLKKLVTSQAASGVTPKAGSVLGVGFAIGFTDVGNGYQEAKDVVNYSKYFDGKNVNGLVLFELVDSIKKGDESNNQSNADNTSSTVTTSSTVSNTVSNTASNTGSTVNSGSTSTTASAPKNNSSVASSQKADSTTSSVEGDDTFDDWWIVIVGAVIILGAGVAFFIYRKKKV